MKRTWTHNELAEHFTLYPDEMGLMLDLDAHNRLGSAILLKCFQYEAIFPQHAYDVPEDVINYLAVQLDVSPAAYEQYNWQGRSIKRHRAKIRSFLGFRPYTEADENPLMQWLEREIFPHEQQIEVLIEKVYQRLRALKIEPPTLAQIERLVRAALNHYDNDLYECIAGKLSLELCSALDNLLEPVLSEDDAPIHTSLYELKQDAGAIGVNSIQQTAARLLQLKALNLPDNLFAGITPKTVTRYRQRASIAAPSFLQRHPAPIRYTLLAAFCWCRQREITDELVELLIHIVHKIGTRAERKVHKELLVDLTRVSGKTTLLFKIAEAAVDNPDKTIRDVLFPLVGEQKLKNLVKEYQSDGPAYKLRIQRTMRGSYGHHYRQMLPNLLDALDFRTHNRASQPVIKAVKLLRRYIASSRRYYPHDENVPIKGVVPPGLHDLVVEQAKTGKMRINRINYEMCVLQALRNGLRCKAIWVAGADHYRNPDEDLPQDFDAQRDFYCQMLDHPLKAEDFIAGLQKNMCAALKHFDETLLSNTQVEILSKNGGWIKVSPLDSLPESVNLRHLKAEIARIWPMVSLLDVLKETDLRVGFTDCFEGIGDRQILDQAILQKRLLLSLYSLGTNTGLKRVSMSEHGETYTDLHYVYQRYIHKDALREAIAKVVNATLHIRQVHIWGEGTTACASDARKLAAWDQNLLTEWHVRYHGRGVVVYWHVNSNATCIYSQLKSCSSSEVAAMIEGVIRHCTEMEVEKNYVDSHGQSEVAFAFCHLLGFELLPRLKNIHSQRLYRPETGKPDAYPHLQHVLTRPINWDLIQNNYDDLLRYATALRLGTADAEAILRRFTRNHPQHPTYKTFAELGKVIKTIFLCRYLASEDLRREINSGLNVVETWNGVNLFIFFGKGGEFSSNRMATQELSMLSLHLLQASLVYINTLMIQQVLAVPIWLNRMTETDWRALSPLIHNHINPYGIFRLDMNQRIPFSTGMEVIA